MKMFTYIMPLMVGLISAICASEPDSVKITTRYPDANTGELNVIESKIVIPTLTELKDEVYVSDPDMRKSLCVLNLKQAMETAVKQSENGNEPQYRFEIAQTLSKKTENLFNQYKGIGIPDVRLEEAFELSNQLSVNIQKPDFRPLIHQIWDLINRYKELSLDKELSLVENLEMLWEQQRKRAENPGDPHCFDKADEFSTKIDTLHAEYKTTKFIDSDVDQAFDRANDTLFGLRSECFVHLWISLLGTMREYEAMDRMPDDNCTKIAQEFSEEISAVASVYKAMKYTDYKTDSVFNDAYGMVERVKKPNFNPIIRELGGIIQSYPYSLCRNEEREKIAQEYLDKIEKLHETFGAFHCPDQNVESHFEHARYLAECIRQGANCDPGCGPGATGVTGIDGVKGFTLIKGIIKAGKIPETQDFEDFINGFNLFNDYSCTKSLCVTPAIAIDPVQKKVYVQVNINSGFKETLNNNPTDLSLDITICGIQAKLTKAYGIPFKEGDELKERVNIPMQFFSTAESGSGAMIFEYDLA